MKSKQIILTSILLMSLLSCNTTSISENWVSPEGLQVTESVYFDANSGDIYVSNINGKPKERNSKGFISKLTIEGELQELKWATGLNAPKGMGVFNRELYVTDIDTVHIINMDTGSIKESITIPEAKFLNDIVVDETGVVYISDTGASKIYAMKNHITVTWLELSEYKKPNGLLIKDGMLLAGTAAGLVSINPETKDQTLIIPLDGGIDGLKSIDENRFVVSDWKGKIQIIEAGMEAQLVRDTTDQKINAADFEYFSKSNALLIPTFFDNRVELLKLN